LHLPQNYRREPDERSEKTAVILMSGASGGVAGPSSIYISMADKIASLRRGIPVLRMDYRYPARNKYCVADVVAAMDFLQRTFGISRFVLVGWSFGGAPVMTVGGQDDRVVGCATVASQTAETDGIERIAAKSLPLLLLHGTGDQTLASEGSERLLERYQRHVKDDMGFLKLFDGDDHALTQNSAKAEAMLCAFVMRCAGVEVSDDEDSVVLRTSLVAREERARLMEEAGDLGEGESLR
jgi:pimeloyl-ACP methyl ester carboxylesterase